jgi:hypothetical protein
MNSYLRFTSKILITSTKYEHSTATLLLKLSNRIRKLIPPLMSSSEFLIFVK